MMTVVGQNTKLKAENETLTSQVTSLKSENESLKKENQQLRSGYVNPMWTKHGSEIDRKLKKGSSSERTDALKDYAAKVKEAYGDIALQQAVNAADKFKEPQFAKPRFFAKFVKTSETSRVATEFQAKVSQELGW
jgi:regulator of replication initiation timing